MPKPKGSAKTGGRKKGTPNKTSLGLTELFNSLNFSVPESLIGLLTELTVEKRADILVDLMGYLYPKRKAIEQTTTAQITEIKPFEAASERELLLELAELNEGYSKLSSNQEDRAAYLKVAEIYRRQSDEAK